MKGKCGRSWFHGNKGPIVLTCCRGVEGFLDMSASVFENGGLRWTAGAVWSLVDAVTDVCVVKEDVKLSPMFRPSAALRSFGFCYRKSIRETTGQFPGLSSDSGREWGARTGAAAPPCQRVSLLVGTSGQDVVCKSPFGDPEVTGGIIPNLCVGSVAQFGVSFSFRLTKT